MEMLRLRIIFLLFIYELGGEWSGEEEEAAMRILGSAGYGGRKKGRRRKKRLAT